jgi:hypothetical protein
MTTKQKRGISFYMAGDAQDINETDAMQLTEEQMAPLLMQADGFLLGSQTKVMVRDAGGSTWCWRGSSRTFR